MRCPFPGMDPYIERSAIWADFHDSLITYIKAALQPMLRPRYVAISQERLYVVESKRPILPDVSVLRTKAEERPVAQAAVLELEPPVVFGLVREEMREPLIHIIEPAADNRLVTAIEVLSPDNKYAGSGRESYLKKREEFWNSGTNLVEIDLLRAGELTVRVSADELEKLGRWHYLAAVTRSQPCQQEVYPMVLERPLRKIAVPLGTEDKDILLDLQAVFGRCYDDGPYPEMLRYDAPPPERI